MSAENISGKAPGGKRARLADALPLATPFVVQIFPVYACNFKCGYCIFSVEKKKRHFISGEVMMDPGLYRKCVDDMAAFPQKIKVLRFVGIGEPLLHKDIAGMIRYTVEKGIADTVELLTNASLLTHEMSDALIAAGLTRLVVSVQGVTREKYRDICGAEIDLDEFIGNLRYFFERRGKARVYVKIVDCALGGKDDEKKFFGLFGEVCDTIAVETAVPIHSGVDFEKVLKDRAVSVTQFGLPVSEVEVCPQPFFHMQINPDGKVVPCYSFDYPGIMGDCREQSVKAIWNGEKFAKFRRAMLERRKDEFPVCAGCSIIKYRLFPEDSLDADAGRLRELY